MKCKRCNFNSVQVEEICNDAEEVVMIQHRCQKCGHIQKQKVVKRAD